ncbi:ABC transporter ATP-binding protein, partial [Lactobacillus helveticus]
DFNKINDRSILVLDEFSSGIDKTTLRKIENKLLDLQTTILYITHVLDDNLSSRFDEVIKLK